MVWQEVRRGFIDVGDVVFADDQILWAHGNAVLEVLLRLVQGGIAVDVFLVRQVGVRRGQAVDQGRLRVAIGVVEVAVAAQDVCIRTVLAGAPVVLEVVCSRVAGCCLIDGRTGPVDGGQSTEIGLPIGPRPLGFIAVRQAIQADILEDAGIRVVVKRVDDRLVL